MLLTNNTTVLTDVGHYSMAHIADKLLLPGRVSPTITPEGEQEAYRIVVDIDGFFSAVEGAGTVTLADNSVVNIVDLVAPVSAEVQTGTDANGDPVYETVTTPGSQLKAHPLAGDAVIHFLSRESIGVVPVFSIAEPVAFSCGITG